jgi:hypothetical protein
MGNQSRLDRELENNLLQQQLRNALQLQGMRGQNNLDLQGLVNSGALDQINARGGWDRTITGDTLSSQERRLAQQLGFDANALQANLGSAAEDRQSRERMHGAGLNNALDLQSMQDQAAFERQKAALLGQQQITGMEIGGRHALQGLIGQQQGQLQAQRGAQEMGLVKARGQLSLDELRENARNTRANLMDQLGVTRELGLGNIENNRYLGQLNAYNQMYDTMQRGVLGQGALDNQRYATDVNADVAQAGQEQSGYQWANDHALEQDKAAEQARYNAAMLKQRQHEYDNPQPAPVPPPPTRQAIIADAFNKAINALPDGSPQEHNDWVNNYLETLDSAGGQPGAAGGAGAGPMPFGMRQQSPETLIKQAQASDALMKLHPYKLMEALGPVLDGITVNNGTLSDADRTALARRGITPAVLQQILGYEPTWEGIDAKRSRYMIQRKARPLRDILLGQ